MPKISRIIRTLQMSLVVVALALAMLALITQAGVVAVQRAYPAQGRIIEVAGRLSMCLISARGIPHRRRS